MVSPRLELNSVLIARTTTQSMLFPIHLELENRTAETLALADSAAGDRFIHPNYVKKIKAKTHRLPQSIRAFNVDGTENKRGTITEYVNLRTTIHGRIRQMRFYICGIGKHDIILGLPWFRQENPLIDWKAGTLAWRRHFKLLPQNPTLKRTSRLFPP